MATITLPHGLDATGQSRFYTSGDVIAISGVQSTPGTAIFSVNNTGTAYGAAFTNSNANTVAVVANNTASNGSAAWFQSFGQYGADGTHRYHVIIYDHTATTVQNAGAGLGFFQADGAYAGASIATAKEDGTSSNWQNSLIFGTINTTSGAPQDPKYKLRIDKTGHVMIWSGNMYGWGNSATTVMPGSASFDTALSRISAGVIGIGTGAAASVAGTLHVAALGLGASAVTNQTITTSRSTTATSGTINDFQQAMTFADGGTTSTTAVRGHYINPTINFTAASRTGSYTALQVDAVETSLPTSTNYLLRLRAGAAGTTDICALTNVGVFSIFGSSNRYIRWNDLTESALPSTVGGSMAIGRPSDGASTYFTATTAANGGTSPAEGAIYSQGGVGGTASAARLRLGGDGGIMFSVNAGLMSTFFAATRPNANWFMNNDGVTFAQKSGGLLAWTSSSTDAAGTVDTTISRNAAGVVQFGTTTANASGSWLATTGTLSSQLLVGTGSFSATPKIHVRTTATGVFEGVWVDVPTSGSTTLGTIRVMEAGDVNKSVAMLYLPSTWVAPGGSESARTSSAFYSVFGTGGTSFINQTASSPFTWNIGGQGATTEVLRLTSTSLFAASGYAIGFSSGNTFSGSLDTNISRSSAGVIRIGTTAANANGGLLAASGIFTAVTGSNATPLQAYSNDANAGGGVVGAVIASFADTSSGEGRQTVQLYDYTSAAQGTGPGVLFYGSMNTGGTSPSSLYGFIKAYKENATNSNGLGSLVFGTQTSASGTGSNCKNVMTLDSNGFVRTRSGSVYGWTSSSTDSTVATALDTGLSRSSAGVVAFGTGGAGSTAGAWTATRGTLSAATGNVLDVTAASGSTTGILVRQTGGAPFALQTLNDSAQNCLYLQQFGTNSSLDQIVLYQARGTSGSPTNVSSGDLLGGVLVYGKGGSTVSDAAAIRVFADGTPSTYTPGRIEFHTASDNNGATGSASKVTIKANGSVILNATGANLAQNATDGFTYVPVCSTGAPSGTPTSVTGAAPIVINGTTLYFYSSGAWQTAGGGGSGAVLTTTVASTATGTTTIDATAVVWPCDTTSAGFTITLPSAAGINGRTYIIKKISSDGNTLTLDANGSETIDGNLNIAWTAQWQSYTVVSNGTNWLIV